MRNEETLTLKSDPINYLEDQVPWIKYLHLERRAPWYFVLSCAFNSASVLMLIAAKTEDKYQVRSAQSLIAVFMAYSILDGTSKTNRQALNFWMLYGCSLLNLFNQLICNQLGLPKSWWLIELTVSITLALVPSFVCDQDKWDQLIGCFNGECSKNWLAIKQTPPIYLRMVKSVFSTVINAIFSMLQSDDPFTGQIFQWISAGFSIVFIATYLMINRVSPDYCVSWQPLQINFQQALNKKPLALLYKLAPFLLLVGLSFAFCSQHDLYQWPQNDFTAWSFLCLAIESFGIMFIIKQADLESMKVELLGDNNYAELAQGPEDHSIDQDSSCGIIAMLRKHCCFFKAVTSNDAVTIEKLDGFSSSV